MKNLESVKPFIGKNVCIRWTNPENDWHWFYVIGIDPMNDSVWVRGIDSPNEDINTDENAFETPIGDIAEMYA